MAIATPAGVVHEPLPPKEPLHAKDKAEKPSLVIVELDEPQPVVALKRLRRGKGKLYHHIGQIVHDLTEDGTVKPGTQPLVIVIQQMPSLPWALDDD